MKLYSFWKPKISVIMASYNHARFVEAAVRSVLDQTYRNIELIIVDDGSTDGTADIIRQISDDRILFYPMAQNRSVHVRNFALSKAKGRYVAFQNSDDLWDTNKLTRQVELMENRPDVQAVFTGIAFVDKHGNPSDGKWAKGLFQPDVRSQTGWLHHFFYSGNCLAIPSAMVRRRTLSSVGNFRETLVQMSDLDLWIRLATRGNFAHVTEPLTTLRIQDSNLSAPSKGTSRRSVIESSRIFERFIEPSALAFYQEIFPDLPTHSTPILQKAEIAVHAAASKDQAKMIFADRVLESIFDDAESRAEVTNQFGANVFADFVERRRYPHVS